MRSIEYLRIKIKSISEFFDNYDMLVIVVVVLVSFSSFGLGRLSVLSDEKDILETSKENLVFTGEGVKDGYVASKKGTTYHLPWCSGAQRISEKNKVWFKTKEEAEKAGYNSAKNCKGI